jgi:hypothetical protein
VYVPIPGRTFENRVPPLDDALLAVTSNDDSGVSARVVAPLSELFTDDL